MIRYLQVVQGKPIALLTASGNVRKGAPAAKDFSDMTVAHDANGMGLYLIDIAPTYEGLNAIVEPTDDAFEDAKTGDIVRVIPTVLGERYATSEITTDGLSEGDMLVASAGKFVKASSGQAAWVYCGEYSDPTGIKMGAIERVEPTAVSGS